MRTAAMWTPGRLPFPAFPLPQPWRRRWLVLGALLAGLALPATAGQVTFPLFDSAGTTLRVFSLDLAGGRVRSLESRRNGESFKASLLEQNLFSTIGRPADQPAQAGEFVLEGIRERGGRTRAYLLVETTTGYVGFFAKPGQNDQLGELRTVTGRPLAPLLGTDGEYMLLVRQEASRRSDVAYLLHASTGECMLLDGVDKVESDPTARSCDGVPPFHLGSNVVPQRAGSGTTTGYLVIDATDSTPILVGYSAEGIQRLILTRTAIKLTEVFPATEAKASGRRFALAPIQDDDGVTTSALVFDRLTGRLALLRNLVAGSRAEARLLAPELAGRYLTRSELMEVEAVPRESGGRTTGVWLVGERGRQALWVSALDSPNGPTVQAVEIRD